jgi:hypothetical protein
VLTPSRSSAVEPAGSPGAEHRQRKRESPSLPSFWMFSAAARLRVSPYPTPVTDAAAAIKLDLVLKDLKPQSSDRHLDAGIPIGGDVVDATASDAGEVIVRRRVRVKAHARSVHALAKQTLCNEQPEVAIDRPETDVREFTPNTAVDIMG